MKRATYLFAFIVSFSTQASYGPLLIAPDAVGTSMGGTGVSAPYNFTNALSRNPAVMGGLALDRGPQLEVNGALIVRDVKTNGGLGDKKSGDSSMFAPGLGVGYRLNDQLTLGAGIIPIGGNAADFGSVAEVVRVQTVFQLARIPLAASYQFSKYLTVGISPFLTFGQLSLNDDAFSTGARSGRNPHGAFGVGAQFGVYSNPMENLGVGLALTTKSPVTYKEITNLDSFGPASGTEFSLDNLKVTQPMELALGAHYRLGTNFLFVGEYRFIEWNGADTYKELGWQHQHVFSLGAEYSRDKWQIRAGANFTNSVIDGITGENGAAVVNFQGHNVFASAISLLNMSAFPAYAKSHLSLGGGYEFCKNVRLDGSFLYVPKQSVTRAGTNALSQAYSFTGTASDWTVGMTLVWKFGGSENAAETAAAVN